MCRFAGACALACVFVPAFARLFLRETRSEVEVRQYAESFFSRRGLFATPRRRSVLVLVSLFERRIEILPDVGLVPLVKDEDWRRTVACMTPLLRKQRVTEALQEGLTALERLLLERGFSPDAAAHELPNRPIEEAGA